MPLIQKVLKPYPRIQGRETSVEDGEATQWAACILLRRLCRSLQLFEEESEGGSDSAESYAAFAEGFEERLSRWISVSLFTLYIDETLKISL